MTVVDKLSTEKFGQNELQEDNYKNNYESPMYSIPFIIIIAITTDINVKRRRLKSIKF